jgi:hypothetical protein
MLFWKRKQRPFSPDQYKIDVKTYGEDYGIFIRQPRQILRELRTVKTVMAICIPLFVVLTALSPRPAIAAGLITGVSATAVFIKKKRTKPAAAIPVSIAIGVVFGLWFNRQLGAFLL